MKKTLGVVTITITALLVNGFLTLCVAQATKDPCAGKQGAALTECRALQKQQDAVNAKTAADKEKMKKLHDAMKNIK
jgi:hypothetical protein